MKSAILVGLLMSASLLPNVYAASTDATFINATAEMETITITYRSPFDYALHQYTVELLNQFRMEIDSSISYQARRSSQAMYEAFSAAHIAENDFSEMALLAKANNTAPK
ncbi:hypothetical protein [Shewanella sp. Isolate11]|uniref:hypothetical protein n=1 Tax=Shewanella sp. Isolate11 TaxID=2908530 RepID=UPI001EFCE270|nr:hypothetical protein [Shewanella sp. Isolate11]MCG9697407.1 hypothetical protein [Shewanella sp. Isolate11]